MRETKLINPVFVDLTSDFGFKKLFGEGPNKELLISFLGEVLGGQKQIVDLEHLPSDDLGDRHEEDGAIFDLLCTGAGGEKFIIEVQRAGENNFKKRAVFHTGRLISNLAPDVGQAAWGCDIREVYLIMLLDGFTITDPGDECCLRNVCLCERTTGKVFYDELVFTYIELQKFNKQETELENDLDRWLFVLKNIARLEKTPACLQNTVFEKVFDLAAYNKLSKEEKMAYDLSLKPKWDEFSIEERIKEAAFEDGMREKARSVARKLLKKGLSIEFIAETTGLSREEIERL